MNQLNKYSKHKFNFSMAQWKVPKDFAEPMYSYLVYGFNPGSFFTSVLANDFMSAVARSHPSNTITALKALTGWIRDHMPRQAWGTYEAVEAWTNLSWEERRPILEAKNLIHSEKEETWLSIKGDPTHDPMEMF